MLILIQQYWPVLVVLLLSIVAGIFWVRRSKHVALDREQPIRPTLSRDSVPIIVEPEVPPPSFHVDPVAGTPDNLLEIKGLGPRIATKLNSLGITRFEQIAQLTPEEQLSLDQQMGPFKGRIEQDRWIDQARILASGDRAAFESEFGKINGG